MRQLKTNIEFYNRGYSDRYDIERTNTYFSYINKCELSLVNRHGVGKRVLEVGCGTGLILSEVQKFASVAIGIDISEDMLAYAKAKDLTVLRASATKLPFPDEYFDVVYSFKVLPHVERISDALSEMGRVLRPGGIMIPEFYPACGLKGIASVLRPSGNYTRLDNYHNALSYIPGGYEVIGYRGFKILWPSVIVRIPLFRNFLMRVDHALSATALGKVGSYMSLIIKKDLGGG